MPGISLSLRLTGIRLAIPYLNCKAALAPNINLSNLGYKLLIRVQTALAKSGNRMEYLSGVRCMLHREVGDWDAEIVSMIDCRGQRSIELGGKGLTLPFEMEGGAEVTLLRKVNATTTRPMAAQSGTITS